MDVLRLLEEWFAGNCDDDWEHQYGVTIETLDNPGWSVSIDLVGTPLSGAVFEEVNIERTEADWVVCRVRSDVFEGFGGASNLRELLGVFGAWKEKALARKPTR